MGSLTYLATATWPIFSSLPCLLPCSWILVPPPGCQRCTCVPDTSNPSACPARCAADMLGAVEVPASFSPLLLTPYHMGIKTELFVSCCLRAFAETPSLVSHVNLSVPVLISSCGWTGGAAVQVIDTTLCLGLFLWSKLCLLG